MKSLVATLGRFLLLYLCLMALVFVALEFIPGSAATRLAGLANDPGAIERVEARLGLDRGVGERLAQWMVRALTFDFGQSWINGQEVGAQLAQRLFVTLGLAVGALVLTVIGSVVTVALVQGPRVPRAIRGVFRAAVGLSLGLPEFLLALMVLFFTASVLQLPVLYRPSAPLSLVLPLVILAASRFGALANGLGASLEQQLTMEYGHYLWQNGMSRKRILWRHLIPASILSTLPFVGIQFSYLLTGALVVEQFFAIPGLGRYLVSSMVQQDYPVVQGGIVVLTASFMGVQLVVGLIEARLSPRNLAIPGVNREP